MSDTMSHPQAQHFRNSNAQRDLSAIPQAALPDIISVSTSSTRRPINIAFVLWRSQSKCLVVTSRKAKVC